MNKRKTIHDIQQKKDNGRKISMLTAYDYSLAKLVDEGWDIVAPVPSCALMFKQELPLLFPGDADVIKVQEACFDPFEYLMLRHKAGKLQTDFKQGLGKIAYHVPCHQRVQKLALFR